VPDRAVVALDTGILLGLAGLGICWMATPCFSAHSSSLPLIYSGPLPTLVVPGLPRHSMMRFRLRMTRSADSEKSTSIPRPSQLKSSGTFSNRNALPSPKRSAMKSMDQVTFGAPGTATRSKTHRACRDPQFPWNKQNHTGATGPLQLEIFPRQWNVIRTVREKFTCRTCEKISQPPARSAPAIADHVSETAEYGVAFFVYRARRSFDPAAVHAVLNGPLPGVIRAKGHFWLATWPDWVAEFSLAGALSTVKPLGIWWAAIPQFRWPTAQSARDDLAAQWAEPFGDRRQELVFIGSGMDRAALSAALDACLIGPADRLAQELARDLADPFPVRRRQEQAA